MANSKSYAYQIKGSKISLLQDQFINDAVGNAYGANGKPSWVSPNESVSEGIEVEYAYSPEYYYNTNSMAGVDKYSVDAWIIVDGYLAFVQGDPITGMDWSAELAPNDYILVKNSSRWNGVHKIQEVQQPIADSASSSHCAIKTYTKVSAANYKYFTGTPTVTSTTINVSGDLFEVGDYLWQSAGRINNIGLYRVSAITDLLGAGIVDALTLDIRVHNKDNQEYATEDQETAVSMAADTDGTTYVYQAFRERPTTHIITGIDILSDESDTIDLPPYLANALVYYVKAKLAEDIGEIELKEYNMREFRVMVGRHSSSKLAGGSRRVKGFF
jgi:hypothetical protein